MSLKAISATSFRADVDGVVVARDLELEQPLRLPRQHLVGQSFERLAEHDEAAALGIARAEVQVAEHALRRPLPHSTARMTRSSVRACLILSHAEPRRPAA